MSEVTGTQNEGAPGPGEPAYAEDSRDGDGELFQRIRGWHKRSRAHRHQWAIEARDSYAYVAGEQWSADDKQAMRDQDRVAITFQLIGPFIDGVCGLEINNRQEQRVIPRQIGSSGVADLETAAVKWVRDTCDAEDEESDAFRDMVVCGEGATDTLPDYSMDPDGNIVIERLDPIALLPDSASIKPNYTDARYFLYPKEMTRDAAREVVPDADDADLDASWARDESDDDRDVPDATDDPFYRNDEAADLETTRDRVTLVYCQWWESRVSYRLSGPHGVEKLSESEFNTLKKRAGGKLGRKHVRDETRFWRKAIVGRKVLDVSDIGPQGPSIRVMTGKRDRNAQCWYGLVRAMKDPQMWTNKWFSQILHILNSNAKGGYFIEADVLQNPDEAMDTITDPQAPTIINPGRMAGIQPKEPPPFPQGLFEMAQFAANSLSTVTGISPEMVTQADRDQPIGLEITRKKQGMVLLATFFSSLRRYRKQQGRYLVWLIGETISDGRLILIGGPEDARWVPLTRRPETAEYQTKVDDTPTSPNMKEQTWAMLMQMAPFLAKLNLPPQALMEMFKSSPLPESLVTKISQMAQQAMQQQGQNPHMQALAQVEQSKAALHGAQTQKVQAETQKISAETGMAVSKLQADIEAAKAGAIANLAKAGVSVAGQQLDNASAAADSLLQMHQFAHDKAMDVAGLGLQQQGADQAAQQAQQGQQQDAQQFAAQHALAQQQAQQQQQGPQNAE